MPLRLTEHERERLRRLARSARDVRVLKRAQALLDLDSGDGPKLVARRYQVTRSTVYNWIKRYWTRGLDDAALRDLPRSGRPRSNRPDREERNASHASNPSCGRGCRLPKPGG